MRVEVPFPFTPEGTINSDAHLVMDTMVFLLKYREQIGMMTYGELEPLTAVRVALVVRFIGSIMEEVLREDESEPREGYAIS